MNRAKIRRRRSSRFWSASCCSRWCLLGSNPRWGSERAAVRASTARASEEDKNEDRRLFDVLKWCRDRKSI